jgi:alpha-mannosidase/octanoyl-[GcvH]:protein N-octanoyltransferase
MQLPKSADERLLEEQKAVVEFTQREAGRSSELKDFTLVTDLDIYAGSPQIKITTSFDNQHEDHRLRALFPTGVTSDVHYAESIYENVERPNKTSDVWVNPENPQHQQSYANVHEADFGLTVSNVGLNEYEVLGDDNTIAVVLLRSVGEMGDWGYFPTPEAQCIGKNTVTYAIEAHGEDAYPSMQRAMTLRVPMTTWQVPTAQAGTFTAGQFVSIDNTAFATTALKKAEVEDAIVLRGFSLDNTSAQPVDITLFDQAFDQTNLIEADRKAYEGTVGQAEIATFITK